jgi:alpha-tubulin suppressor-like RCC1 family protein
VAGLCATSCPSFHVERARVCRYCVAVAKTPSVTLLLAFVASAVACLSAELSVPTRPSLPLQRPAVAGEVCSLSDDLAVPEPPSPEFLTNVVAVAAAGSGTSSHYVVLKADGTLRAWGKNSSGECNIPAALTNVVAIEAGQGFTIALEEDGTVLSWGRSDVVSLMPANLTAVAIAAGGSHALALRPNGTVAAWGVGSFSANPEQVTTAATWSGAVAVAAGGTRSAAIRADGVVLAAGEPTPITTGAELQINGEAGVAAISISDTMAVALTTNRTVIFSGATNDHAGNPFTAFKQFYAVSNVVRVASGYNRGLALRSDGYLEAWGINNKGQSQPTTQGLRNIIGMSSSGILFIRQPVARPQLPIPTRPTRAGNLVSWGPIGTYPATLTNIVQADYFIALNPDGTVVSTNAPSGLSDIVKVGEPWALRADGTVVSWGNNDDGKSRVAPPGLSNVVDVALGGYYPTLFALCSDGSIVTWPYPSRLPLNPEPSVAIAAGIQHVSAVRGDGTVTTWGSMYTAGMPEVFALEQPAGLTNVIAITAESSKSVAVKADGSVVAWGIIYDGDENPPALTNAIAIKGTVILKSDGTVVSWAPFRDAFTYRPMPGGLTNVVNIGSTSAIVGTEEILAAPPQSAPIQAARMLSGERLKLSQATQPGHIYQFLASYNLIDWAPMKEPTVAQTDTMTLEVVVAGLRQFYRLAELR